MTMSRPLSSRTGRVRRVSLEDLHQHVVQSPVSDMAPHGYRGEVTPTSKLMRPPSRRNPMRQPSLDETESFRPYSSGSDEGYVPSPPPRPLSSQRGQQLHERPHSSKKSHSSTAEEDLPNVSVVRPSSSFNKFRPLPSIGRSQSGDTGPIVSQFDRLYIKSENDSHVRDTEETQRRGSTSSNRSQTEYGVSIIPKQVDETSEKVFTGSHILPREPSSDEARLLLAVKLPTDGSRHQRYFSPEDYLQDLHHFAENVGNTNLSDYVLACNMPRKVFNNLTQRICDAGIPHKTVLYFEEREDAD